MNAPISARMPVETAALWDIHVESVGHIVFDEFFRRDITIKTAANDRSDNVH